MVDEQRKVPIGLNPAREGSADDSFGSRANNVGLTELARGNHAGLSIFVFLGLETMMRHDGTLSGKAFGVFGFLFKEGKRDEEREIGVLVAGCLETSVEVTLDGFPNRKAPRLDHHAATGFGVLGQIGSANDLLVPLGKVFRTGGSDC